MLFTFPSRYLFTIGHERVFSLTRWFSQIPTEFHLLRGTWERYSKEPYCFHLQDFHLLWLNFPEHSANNIVFYSSAYWQFSLNTPHNTANTTVASFNMSDGLGCFLFARHYSGNHYCFLFLGYLDVSLPRVGFSQPMNSACRYPDITRGWVAPFGDLRVKGCFHLSEAYRR